MRQVIRVLTMRELSNPVLIGEAGSGKTAIVQGIAAGIVDDRFPPLSGRRIVD